MKKLIYQLIILALFTLLGNLVSAQSMFNVHAGASFPLSDYKADDISDESAGGAGIGFTTGMQYTYQLTESGLGVFVGVDFVVGGYQDDVKDQAKDLYENLLGITDADYTWPKFLNLPFTGGLNIKYNIDEKVSLFANGGIALNFFKLSDFSIKSGGETLTTTTEWANGVGFKIGGGIIINDKVSILVDYYGLGKHDLNLEVKIPGSGTQKFDGEQKVDMINLSLGLSF